MGGHPRGGLPLSFYALVPCSPQLYPHLQAQAILFPTDTTFSHPYITPVFLVVTFAFLVVTEFFLVVTEIYLAFT